MCNVECLEAQVILVAWTCGGRLEVQTMVCNVGRLVDLIAFIVGRQEVQIAE